MCCSVHARETLVSSLRREVARLEMSRPPEDERPISTGSPALDGLLPAGGLRRGTLVEYLTAGFGNGAGTLALNAAREACQEGRALVVVERDRGQETGNRSLEFLSRFYPLAAAAWGIDLARVLVLRPVSEADSVWALDQALRCRGVGAVWAACDRLDVRDFQRLQLAAECGGTVGLFIRPAWLRGQPTWAEIQWMVSPRSRARSPKSKVQSPRSKFQVSSFKFQVGRLSTLDFRLSPWRLEVELIRCRGAAEGQKVLLELDEAAGVWREVSDEATHTVPVLPRLADPTAARRA
jgi:protein ImuA